MDTIEGDDCRMDLFEEGCSLRLVLDRIGDRWTILIVELLTGGPQRFSKLRGAIGGITPKVLTQTLRAMERDGLVTRTVYAEVPPRVEYALTDLGRALVTPLNQLCDWAERHVDDFLAARETYDAAARPERQPVS
jgi:DNA-binding HxlR family transcriptional regulator